CPRSEIVKKVSGEALHVVVIAGYSVGSREEAAPRRRIAGFQSRPVRPRIGCVTYDEDRCVGGYDRRRPGRCTLFGRTVTFSDITRSVRQSASVGIGERKQA